jgi:hypothetical protein
LHVLIIQRGVIMIFHVHIKYFDQMHPSILCFLSPIFLQFNGYSVLMYAYKYAYFHHTQPRSPSLFTFPLILPPNSPLLHSRHCFFRSEFHIWEKARDFALSKSS